MLKVILCVQIYRLMQLIFFDISTDALIIIK